MSARTLAGYDDCDAESNVDESRYFNKTQTVKIVQALVDGIGGNSSGIDENNIKSGPLIYYNLEDNDYYIAIAGLLITFIVLRVVCILLLKRLATFKN